MISEWLSQYPEAEKFSIKNQEYFLFQNWFFELYAQSDAESNHKGWINFEFNFDPEQKEVFKKACAMGLLSFHFYHPLSLILKEKGIEATSFQNPELKTFIALYGDIPSIIENLKQSHLDITVAALELIQNIQTNYNL